jgi:site-specific DNA-cytosine methylase
MNTIELFSGSKSFSKVRKSFGDKTFTVDYINKFDNDLTIDILKLKNEDLPNYNDVIWASPPCTTFSVASIGAHWEGGSGAYVPKTEQCRIGLKILEKTIKIISQRKPKYYYIENPRGVMRKIIDKLFIKYGLNPIRNTIWYCQYGDLRGKPTDIWTNNLKWNAKPVCKNYRYDKQGNIINKHCHHESARRGAKTGTQGLKNDFFRSQIPKELFIEIRKTEKNIWKNK